MYIHMSKKHNMYIGQVIIFYILTETKSLLHKASELRF